MPSRYGLATAGQPRRAQALQISGDVSEWFNRIWVILGVNAAMFVVIPIYRTSCYKEQEQENKSKLGHSMCVLLVEYM